jgi:hypothetical protein
MEDEGGRGRVGEREREGEYENPKQKESGWGRGLEAI